MPVHCVQAIEATPVLQPEELFVARAYKLLMLPIMPAGVLRVSTHQASMPQRLSWWSCVCSSSRRRPSTSSGPISGPHQWAMSARSSCITS